MKKVCLGLLLLLPLSMATSSCYTMNHQVGTGSSGASESHEQQWWILWGLVPLNHVDSHTMAGGATNYNVKTQFTPLDVLISFFTQFVTIYVQTIEVKT